MSALRLSDIRKKAIGKSVGAVGRSVLHPGQQQSAQICAIPSPEGAMNETRKIAAILVSDVVGYSRLVGADEDRTLARLRALRSDMIDPIIAVHHGRVVKRTGDGSIVEFRSVTDAVRCALEVQEGMVERNAGLSADRRIEFRIGIHLGEIIEESDGDLMGDGVNIAARLEGICEVGGVCLSEDAYRQVRDKIKEQFINLGEQALKNIARPMRAYRVISDWNLPKTGPIRPELSPTQLVLPDKPSLAVLPFQNMSGDVEQEYFADGIVEELTTALSRFGNFSVVSRSSAFVYKNRVVDVRQTAKELGVRYLLEGGVRRQDKRVRVTAKLLDAAAGSHLWADKFEGNVDDIFDFQDKITETVVGLIEPKIRLAEIERARRKRPDSLDAYDLYLRALPLVYGVAHDGYAVAIDLLKRAIKLDPDFALALAYASWTLEKRITLGLPSLGDDDEAECLRFAQAALRADGDEPLVLAIVGFVTIVIGGSFETGLATLRRAVEANPNNLVALNLCGVGNMLVGDIDESAARHHRALRLSPNAPDAFWSLTGLGMAELLNGNFESAINWCLRSLATFNEWPMTYWALIPSYAHLDRMDEARAALGRLLAIVPGTTEASVLGNPRFAGRLEVQMAGLRKAGLPRA
jgi:TolB-like protein/class 3 adenylate cyclase